MQHAQHEAPQQQQQATAGNARRQQGSQQQQQTVQQAGVCAPKLTVDYQQALSGFLATLQKLPESCRSAALELAAVQSLSLLLQASSGALQPCTVAAWLRDAAQAVLRIQLSDVCSSSSGSGSVAGKTSSRRMRSKTSTKELQQQQQLSEEAAAELLALLGPFVPPVLPGVAAGAANGAGSAAAMSALPPLLELLPVLQPALTATAAAAAEAGSTDNVAGSDAAAHVQAAALQLLLSYLQAAAHQAGSVSGSKQLLLDALALVCSPAAAVRNAALQLVQLFMRPAVLQEMFGSQPEQQQQQQQQQQQRRRQRNAAPAAAAAPAADVEVVAGQCLARRLLEHLRSMLGNATAAMQDGQQQQQQQQQQQSITAQLALLRAIAGLYGSLAGSGACAELPLLYLVEQCALSEYGQVRWKKRYKRYAWRVETSAPV
jgi:hypothetical protein